MQETSAYFKSTPFTNHSFSWRRCNLSRGKVTSGAILGCVSYAAAAAAAAKSLQSCPTLYDPRGGSPPGSPVPGILQARTLEWVAIAFSNAWKWKVKVKSLSHVQLLVTPWTAAHQAPPSMGFSRREHWSGCHCLLRVSYATGVYSFALPHSKGWRRALVVQR